MYMQKFILFILIIGLLFFLFLLKEGYISKENFNIKNFTSQTYLTYKKSNNPLNDKSSDIYAYIKGKEYEIVTLSSNEFEILTKSEYPLNIYKVPLEAKSAITTTILGQRIIFYIIENNKNGQILYEIYKAEYPTDNISQLEYFKIKTIDQTIYDNKIEVTY